MPRYALVLFALCVAAAPARADMDDAARALMVQQLRAHHILPRHDLLAAQTRDLTRYVTAFCSLADAAHLDAAREAFSEAYLAFMGIQHMRFGPALVDDRHYRLQYWPDKHNQGARQLGALLAAHDPVPDADTIGASSVAVQGFPALERVLFEGGVELFEGQAGERRCALALAIAGNIETVASDLFVAWFEYAPDSDADLIAGLFDGMLEAFRAITELKLKRPLGDAADAARPTRAEAWRSALSYAAVRANLFALHGLVMGEGNSRGFSAALGDDEQSTGIAGAIDEHFRYGIGIVEARTAALAQEVTTQDGREFVGFLIVHVDTIRDLILQVFPRALDVTAGFNALDGD